MHRIILICFTLVIEILSLYENQQASQQTMAMTYQIRCTRRYTPGICANTMAVVWTFVFQIQNCSERIGCPIAGRTNRFINYRNCMRRCRPLADLYSQVLAAGGGNDSDYEPTDLRAPLLQALPVAMVPGLEGGRRDGVVMTSDLESFTQQDSDPGYDDRFGDLPLVNPLGDREVESDLEDITPPDIDRFESDHVPNPFDLFHDAFGTN